MTEEKVVKPQVSKLQQEQVEQSVEAIDTPEEVATTEDTTVTPEKETEEGSQVRTSKNLARTGHYMADPLFHEVCYYFGIEPQEYSLLVKRVSSIVDWAIRNTQSTKPIDILEKIKKLERELPAPGIGEKRHTIIYRYIRLMGQRDELDRKMKVYKK